MIELFKRRRKRHEEQLRSTNGDQVCDESSRRRRDPPSRNCRRKAGQERCEHRTVEAKTKVDQLYIAHSETNSELLKLESGLEDPIHEIEFFEVKRESERMQAERQADKGAPAFESGSHELEIPGAQRAGKQARRRRDLSGRSQGCVESWIR